MRTLLVMLLATAACTKAASTDGDKPAPTTAPTASANHVGAPISASAPVVALAAVMKDPAAYKGKPFVTTGTVTAVCQEAGCWMEIKDADSQAHIKMAGEKFFVPKTSAGRKARVQGTLVDVAGDGDVQCAHEAAEQTGGKVAKLQLEATGVELD